MRKDFSAAVKRQVNLYSRGHCMICDQATTKPRVAHIIPAAKNGPRSEFKKGFSESFVISPENGLSLCNKCHDDIDDEGLNRYSLEELFEINRKKIETFKLEEEYRNSIGIYETEHALDMENFYARLLEKLNMTDEEIEELLISNKDFKKVHIEIKMDINEFTPYQRRLINEHFAFKFHVFRESIKNNVIISTKITAGVKILYTRILKKNKNQSEIFNEMKKIMTDPTNGELGNDIVLIYFFIICEVFLK